MTTMTVTPLSAQDVKSPEFGRWLADTEDEWFLEYQSPSPAARAQHLMSRFEGALASSDGHAFRFTEGEQTLGAIALERLAWDSAHFGIECGRIAVCCIARGLSAECRRKLYADLLQEARRWAHSNNVELLQRRLLASRAEEIRCLESVGFHLADKMVTMLAPLANVTPSDDYNKQQFIFRDACESDLKDIRLMTHGAFPHSRFMIDPKLKQHGEEVYQRWIENLVRNERTANAAVGVKTNVTVCITGPHDAVAGYAAYRTDRHLDELLGRRLGMLDLIVVARAMRHQGLGRALLTRVMDAMRKEGATDVEATTWTDQAKAVALYRHAGLQEKETLLTYHLWLN